MLKKKYLLGILFGSFATTLFFLAQTPNTDLHWSRKMNSDLSPSRIDRNLRWTSRWPQWFHGLTEVQHLNPQPNKPQEIFTGARLTLKIEPKKGVKKPFLLTVEVVEYHPENQLKLKILEDSSSKLTHIFDELDWTIRLTPKALKNSLTEGSGATLEGSVHAHTSHWRSRLFGKLAKKILMYQVFYPDLMKLSQLRQPFSIEEQIKPAGMME